MTNKRILLLGGGGHCKSVLDSLLSLDQYDDIGIVDNKETKSVLGVPIVGLDNDLALLYKDGWTDAFISVGSIGSTYVRRKLFYLAKQLGFNIPSIVDASSIVANNVQLGEGVFIGKRAVVNSGSVVDDCAIINTGAIIEHDCRISEFVHISPNATLCGNVSVGIDSHVGAGSVVRQGLTIGSNTIIGIGSVLVKDVPDCVTAYGNPCRVVNQG